MSEPDRPGDLPGSHDVVPDGAHYEVTVPDAVPGEATHWNAGYRPPPPVNDTGGYGSGGYASGSWPAPGAPAASSRRPAALWWGMGGLAAAALVLVLLIATGVFTAKNDDDQPSLATGQYDPGSGGSGGTGGSHRLRIVDKDSGISYDYLGEGWKDWTQGTLLEYQTIVGEYIITQPQVPAGGEFIAQVTSGLLDPSFGGTDASGFPSMLVAIEKSVRGNYYPQPNTPTNEAEKSLTIDGHPAYQRSMDLTWDVAGYDSTGERAVLLLIDTGKSEPVFFYCSFPNTHAELYPLIEQVIDSIKVDQ